MDNPSEHFQGRSSIFDVNNGKVIYSFDKGKICIGQDICSDEIRWSCWIDFNLGYVIEVPEYDIFYIKEWLNGTGLTFEPFLNLVSGFDVWGRAASEAGYLANKCGLKLNDNPYSEGEEKHWGWLMGWEDSHFGKNKYSIIKENIN